MKAKVATLDIPGLNNYFGVPSHPPIKSINQVRIINLNIKKKLWSHPPLYVRVKFIIKLDIIINKITIT